MLLKVRLSEVPADMLRQGDCFALAKENPVAFYTLVEKVEEAGGSIGVDIFTIPDGRRQYWVLDAMSSVFLISPQGQSSPVVER